MAEDSEAAPFTLSLRDPRLLSDDDSLKFAQAALASQPRFEARRFQVASLLSQRDGNSTSEAIDLLRGEGVCEFASLSLLASLLLKRRQAGDADEALDLAQRCMALGTTANCKASALVLAGRSLLRLLRLEEGRTFLDQALQLDAQNREALKALTWLNLEQGNPEDVLQSGQTLASQGVSHAYLASGRQNALARLGRMDEAREAQGLEDFLQQLDPEPPAGCGTREEFNHALAQEILTHPDMRYEWRGGDTGNNTWIVQNPVLVRTPALQELQRLLQREVSAYVTELLERQAEDRSEFLRRMPRRAMLYDWCVIVDGGGHEQWHVHHGGWLSGVYYIQVPDEVVSGNGPGGCLVFGLPGELAGEEASRAFGMRVIRPHAGLMVLFPSHAYHRTYPFGKVTAKRRICYSFDVNPLLEATRDDRSLLR